MNTPYEDPDDLASAKGIVFAVIVMGFVVAALWFFA